MLAAVVTAFLLTFHLVPVPDDTGLTAEFALQGYSVPKACTVDGDIAGGCPRTVTDAPVFLPETDAIRPAALISFVAPLTGECIAAQTETIGGDTRFVPGSSVDVVRGKRAFLPEVLLALSDVRGDPWEPLLRRHYRITVMCQSDGQHEFSSFYEAEMPGGAT